MSEFNENVAIFDGTDVVAASGTPRVSDKLKMHATYREFEDTEDAFDLQMVIPRWWALALPEEYSTSADSQTQD